MGLPALLLLGVLLGGVADASTERLPVVVVPGFLGFDEFPGLGSYLPSTVAALRARGDTVFIVRAPAVASSETRAAAFATTVRQALDATHANQVVVVGYSQGGLDVRAALDDPAVAARVGAVVTISTPHGGTPTATMVERLPRAWVSATLSVLQAVWNDALFVPRPLRARADVDGAFASMSETRSARFNHLHPGSPVPFFSVAGVTGRATADVDVCAGSVWGTSNEVDVPSAAVAMGRLAHRLAGHTDATDGTTPTSQARFGTFLGCLPIDHADWMGPVRDDAIYDHDSVVLALVDGLFAASRHPESSASAMIENVVDVRARARRR